MTIVYRLHKYIITTVLLLPFLGYTVVFNTGILDKLLFVFILITSLILYFKKAGGFMLRIFVIFTTYLLISGFLYRYYGFDDSLMTPSLYLIIFGPLFLIAGSKSSSRLIATFSLLLTIVTIYEINYLWLDNKQVEYYDFMVSLGYGRDALPHFGPIYIPLGVLFDHHTTSWVYFALSLFYFRRLVIYSLFLGFLGFLHFSLTNGIIYIFCLLFTVLSPQKDFKFSVNLLPIIAIISLVCVLTYYGFDDFLKLKIKSENTDSFYKWTSGENFIISLNALVLGHGGQMNYDIVRSEISYVKILYGLGLPLLFITSLNYFEYFASKWKQERILIFFFVLSLMHYGVAFRFIPFFLFTLLINNDISKC